MHRLSIFIISKFFISLHGQIVHVDAIICLKIKMEGNKKYEKV